MSKVVELELLRSVRIASPCSMRWEDMNGDGRTRHCEQCGLHVHDISNMSESEAEAFLRSAIGAGRVCASLFRRADGTILTKDCPIGLRAARERAGRVLARAAAVIGLIVTAAVLAAKGEKNAMGRARIAQLQPFKLVYERFNPPAPTRLMGDICIPIPPRTPTPK